METKERDPMTNSMKEKPASPLRCWIVPALLEPAPYEEYGQTMASTKRRVMADEPYLSLQEHSFLIEEAKRQARAEAEAILDYIANEVHELMAKTRPSERGHFPRRAGEQAVNIAFNIEAILSLRDPKKLEEYGYRKLSAKEAREGKA